jgi:hypothetical protein
MLVNKGTRTASTGLERKPKRREACLSQGVSAKIIQPATAAERVQTTNEASSWIPEFSHALASPDPRTHSHARAESNNAIGNQIAQLIGA